MCDAATFTGNKNNTYFRNANELTGALVSKFDPSPGAQAYTNQKVLDTKQRQANPQADVGIDYNAALANLAVGIASLPESFVPGDCPGRREMAELLSQSREEASSSRRRRQ